MKKSLTALLALLTLSGVLASCGDTPSTSRTGTDAANTNKISTETEAVTETETTVPRIETGLPEADFNGYDFRVITRGSFNQHWSSKDIYAEEENGDPINDAVYQRNQKVTEQYNFKITEIRDIEDIAGTVRKSVLGGEDAYDMICAGINGPISTLASGGVLLDLNEVPNLNLTQPWYDQNANAALSIAGKLHVAVGDLTIMDNDATWIVLYNKKLAEDYDMGSFYEMVNNGTWTIDVMTALAKSVVMDLNGDGIHDENDQWGVIGEDFNTFAYIIGGGSQLVVKDSNDIPQLALDNERLINVYEKAATINGDYDTCMFVTNFQSKATSTGDVFVDLLDGMFTSNKVLFNTCGMNRVTLFRSMEADFGILPLPKYDEAQAQYYSPVHLWCTNSIAIPNSSSDPGRVGHIIEALSAESLYTLTPAYYEQTLKTKASRDEESAVMLDMIFANRTYDLSQMYDFGQIFSTINALPSKNNANFASTVEKRTKAAQKALDKIVNFYLEQE